MTKNTRRQKKETQTIKAGTTEQEKTLEASLEQPQPEVTDDHKAYHKH